MGVTARACALWKRWRVLRLSSALPWRSPSPDGHTLSPPGWTGIVVIDGAVWPGSLHRQPSGTHFAKGMLPQWRARLESSKRVASAPGFRAVGSQLSIYVSADQPPGDEGKQRLVISGSCGVSGTIRQAPVDVGATTLGVR